jgi:hypothetical protein
VRLKWFWPFRDSESRVLTNYTNRSEWLQLYSYRVYPCLELCPGGGWLIFHGGGVSGIPIDPVIPETGAAVHVKLYE